MLCLFESDQGYVFGGYTKVGFTAPLAEGSKKVRDKDAWIVSLSHESVHRQIDEENGYAMEHNKDYLAIFGSK